MQGGTRNSEKRTVVLIVKLQFSEFPQSGHLEPFRELSLNPRWAPPILRKSLTKIVEFWALPDIWKVGPLRFYPPLSQTIQEAMKGEVTYLT